MIIISFSVAPSGDLTTENAENTEGDKRDEYRTMKSGFDIISSPVNC
jgi:hypothetical protein